MDNKIRNLISVLKGEPLDKKALTDVNIGTSIIEVSRALAQRIRLNNPKAGDLIEAMASFCWAYPILTESRQISERNRDTAMFYGPLFTSENYPWPLEGGRYLEPVVQFYLEDVGELEGRDIGSGLLQLWMGSAYDDYVLRLIPKEHVCTAHLTPPPETIKGEYFEEIVTSDGPDAWEGDLWRGPFCWEAWPLSDRADFITGTSTKILNWCSSIEQYRTEIEEVSDPSLMKDIESFMSIIPEECAGLSEDHFFGKFDPIQYESRGLDVLLACESGGWGVGGNWQIVMSADALGKREFQFFYSCQ